MLSRSLSVYQCLLVSTSVYQCLLMSTCVYQCLLVSTNLNLNHCLCSHCSQCLLVSTSVYQCPGSLFDAPQALIVSWLQGTDQGTKGPTMSVIELSWTAKNTKNANPFKQAPLSIVDLLFFAFLQFCFLSFCICSFRVFVRNHQNVHKRKSLLTTFQPRKAKR